MVGGRQDSNSSRACHWRIGGFYSDDRRLTRTHDSSRDLSLCRRVQCCGYYLPDAVPGCTVWMVDPCGHYREVDDSNPCRDSSTVENKGWATALTRKGFVNVSVFARGGLAIVNSFHDDIFARP